MSVLEPPVQRGMPPMCPNCLAPIWRWQAFTVLLVEGRLRMFHRDCG